MLRSAFCLIFAAISLFGQIYVAKSVKENIKRNDLEKRAVLYICNVKTEADRKSADAFSSAALGRHLRYDDIRFAELDMVQYEILCEMTGLYPNPDQAVFVLYHNKKSVQFPIDAQKIELLEEFKKLGWLPLEERLEAFLKRNPRNQEALRLLLDCREDEAEHSQDNSLPPSFLKTIKMINDAGSSEWMHTSVFSPDSSTVSKFAYAPTNAILKDSPEFQKEMKKFLNLIENEILKNPYKDMSYSYWSAYARYIKKPDPWKLLSQISFLVPIEIPLFVRFHELAFPLFSCGMEEECLKFLDDIEKWMDAQDIANGNGGANFTIGRSSLAVDKMYKLIMRKRYSDLEQYLRDIRYKLGPGWTSCQELLKQTVFRDEDPIVDNKEIPNIETIKEILELPPIEEDEKHSNSFIILHNFTKESSDKLQSALSKEKMEPWVGVLVVPDSKLPQNAWTLKNANVFVASGSIAKADGDTEAIAELMGFVAKERRKRLKTLENFIRLHPENLPVKYFYCEETAKYLPDEELENNIYAYSAQTGIPPRPDVYSKMEHKANWSSLALKMVAEGLVKMQDYGHVDQTWYELSGWEDINSFGKPIDWYMLLKTTDFFYAPMYYMQRSFALDAVFMKFLKQAEMAGDWEAMLNACEARFNSKADCKNEQVLQAWSKTEEKLKK